METVRKETAGKVWEVKIMLQRVATAKAGDEEFPRYRRIDTKGNSQYKVEITRIVYR